MMGAIDDERTFLVKIDSLLSHLHKNRDEHAAIVEEAQANFRKQCIHELDKMLADAQLGKPIIMSIGLMVPTSHIDAFDNAIGLLEMMQETSETMVSITSGEYQNFVQNRWGWTRQFSSSNSAYTERV